MAQGYRGPIVVVREEEWQAVLDSLQMVPRLETADLRERIAHAISRKDFADRAR